MIRGCGGTLSLVVHAFGPSFRTIPPRASHYSIRETLSFGLPIEPFQSRSLSSSIQIVLECLLTDDVSGNVDQRARALKQPIVFEDRDSLPINFHVQSHCPEILVLCSSHNSASLLFLSFKGLDRDSNDFVACRAALDDQALQRIFLK